MFTVGGTFEVANCDLKFASQFAARCDSLLLRGQSGRECHAVEARKLLDGAGYDANALNEPRLTVMKKNKDEIVAYHYGINRKTYQVERVARTRRGVLIRYQNFQIDRHPVGDRLPETECAVVFKSEQSSQSPGTPGY
jgi:hypothetical protein